MKLLATSYSQRSNKGLLRMRALLLISILSVCGYAWSDEPNDHKPATQNNQSTNQKKINPGFDTTSLEKTIRESIKEATEKLGPNSKEKLESDIKLVEYTGQLSDFTKWLVIATFFLAVIAIWQGIQLRRTVDIAVKESQPVLFPYITDMRQLHPLIPIATAFTHDANIFISFDNYGKTPGIIRQVFAELFITDRGILPVVDFEKLKPQEYQVMVPGNVRGKDDTMGHLDLKQTINFGPREISEVLHEAEGNFRRFVLIGKVIYDDFFGMRHTSYFSVKMRLWITNEDPLQVSTFQISKGGSKYNRVTSEKIPKNDPLDKI